MHSTTGDRTAMNDPTPSNSPSQQRRSTARKRRFLALLTWNAGSTVVLTLLLWVLLEPRLGTTTALSVTGALAALLLFMGAVLAAYFAFLRTGI